MLGGDDLLNLNLPAASLQAAGFALVALVYGGYVWQLLRTGLLQRPVSGSARAFFLAMVASAAWGTANNTIDTEVKRRLQVQAGTRAIPPRTAWGADNETVGGARSPSRQLELQAGLAIEWKPF